MAGIDNNCKAVFLAWWCFLFGCCPSVLLAQKTISTAKPITLELDNVTLQDAYKKIFTQAGVAYRIQPEVVRTLAQVRITLHVQETPLQSVLDCLNFFIGTTSISYQIVKGVYVIGGPRITLSLKEAPPDQALTQFFDNIGTDYIFVPRALGTAKITLDFKDESVEQALKQLLQQMQPPSALTVQKIGAIYVLRPQAKHHLPEETGRTAWEATFHFTHVPGKQAIEAVFCALNFNFLLPEMELMPIALTGKAMPEDILLNQVLRQAGGDLTYAFEGNVFIVEKQNPNGAVD